MIRPRIYIAGSYRGKTEEQVEANVAVAARYGLHFARKGWCPVVPRTMTHGMALEDKDKTVSPAEWLEITAALLEICDAAFFMPGWHRSEGARAEMEQCMVDDIPFWQETDHVPPVEGFWAWEREHMLEMRRLDNGAQGEV